jgi:hypothetical protein
MVDEYRISEVPYQYLLPLLSAQKSNLHGENCMDIGKKIFYSLKECKDMLDLFLQPGTTVFQTPDF